MVLASTPKAGPLYATDCSSNASAIIHETGSINSFISVHAHKESAFSGTAFTTGGEAKCQGTTAGVVQSCISPTCNIDLSISATVDGVGAAIKFPGSDVWQDSQAQLVTCTAQPVPKTVAGGGGGKGPGACNTATPSGGSGSFTQPIDPIPSCSPIIIDTDGEGFHLTSADNGVMFDMTGSGELVQLAWTAAGSHNAFLTLPGPDGLVHNGKQLFGNFTPQDPATRKNGFLALQEWNEPDQGGNGDGVIDERDAVFSRLRLWIDANHDGISQPSELHPLSEFGVFSIALDYQMSPKKDQYGNEFRYRARVNPGQHRDQRDEASEVGRCTYDVFLVAK
jgi:hypothetical protein